MTSTTRLGIAALALTLAAAGCNSSAAHPTASPSTGSASGPARSASPSQTTAVEPGSGVTTVSARQFGVAALATPAPGPGPTSPLPVIAAERDGSTLTLIYLRDDCQTLAAIDLTTSANTLAITVRVRATAPTHVAPGGCTAITFLEAARTQHPTNPGSLQIIDASTGSPPLITLPAGTISIP